MKNRLVIVDGVRTPFSKMGTELARLGADELGRIAVNALLTRTGLDPALVDETIFGCVAQPASQRAAPHRSPNAGAKRARRPSEALVTTPDTRSEYAVRKRLVAPTFALGPGLQGLSLASSSTVS